MANSISTGTHWHLGILHMLFEGRADHYTTHEDEINEFLDACPTENLPPPVKPRVLFGHLRFFKSFLILILKCILLSQCSH